MRCQEWEHKNMNNTQLKQVLAHLKQGKTISQAEAIDLFNCYRQSAIIQRLRNAGYDIVTHNERNKSGIGRHARYELIKQVAAWTHLFLISMNTAFELS